MKKLVLLGALALSSCATSAPDVPTVLSQPLDSTVRQQVAQARAHDLLSQLTTGKVKFNGPVTIQVGGSGNVANATAKAKAPVATGPHPVASETRPAAGGPPWWLWLVVAGGAFVGGFVVRHQLKLPGLG